MKLSAALGACCGGFLALAGAGWFLLSSKEYTDINGGVHNSRYDWESMLGASLLIIGLGCILILVVFGNRQQRRRSIFVLLPVALATFLSAMVIRAPIANSDTTGADFTAAMILVVFVPAIFLLLAAAVLGAILRWNVL